MEALLSGYSSDDEDPDDLEGLDYIPHDNQDVIPIIGGGHDRGTLGGSPVHTDLEGDSDRDTPAATGDSTDEYATSDSQLQGNETWS